MISICLITIRGREQIEDRIQEACDNALGDFQFILISNPNGGVAENRNSGLKKAKGDVIIFIDDDLYGYPKGWNKIFSDKLKEDLNCLMVGPRLLNRDGSLQNTISKCPNNQDDWIKVPYLPGACMCYRKNNLLFDEQYRAWGMEDPDIELQMKKIKPNGYFLLCNKIKLIHYNEMKNMKLHDIENKQKFIRKWGFIVE